ncbi:phage major capsid protein [Sedimentitalea sp. CY04]|uniref:Phage major capsid protein n=1 Tax=Parasedimentitalea denitrificans TaxID=2211118 RepID=A0ABX0WC59_9RHOB|nr:phage major capsid protein [Sedimentitalea sp. CY04]NIZ63293.1 phage major capsid protein [Sedimentitalea sp. CY04]
MKKLMMPAICMAALASACPVHVMGAPMNDASDEAMLKQVQGSLDKINGETKTAAENALTEAKKAGTLSAETKASVDKLLTVQNTLNDTLKALTDKVEGVASEHQEMAQAIAEGVGQGGSSAPMSLGQAVLAEGDEGIKNFLANGAKGNLRIGVSNAITSAAGSGGGLTYHEEERSPVNMPYRRLRIRGLVSHGRTGSDLVKYRKQTLRTDATAAIAETGTYPESAFGWSKAQTEVKKIGAVTNISEETMADADQLQSEIDTELRFGLDLETEKQILAGDGVGENLLGLIPSATAFVAASGLPDATRLDRLRLAVLQVVLADYIPTHFVMNPTDWAGIDLLKDTQGRYIFGHPGSQSTPALWGKDVVESNSMSVGDWLTGDLQMAATLYDRSEAEILISSEHGTNFIEDMLTMKARKRMALAVKRPAAMVKGNFTFA